MHVACQMTRRPRFLVKRPVSSGFDMFFDAIRFDEAYRPPHHLGGGSERRGDDPLTRA